MRHKFPVVVWLALACVALCAQEIPAPSAPPCSPNSAGCTRAWNSPIADGTCVVWFSPGEDVWDRQAFCGKYADLPDRWLDLLYGTKAERAAMWKTLMTWTPSAQENAAVASIAEPPSLYVVASNGSSTSRPTYPVAAGKRLTRSNGRIPVGSDCQCDLQHLGSYCSVNRIENTVTLCALRN